MPAPIYYRQIRLPLLASGDQRLGHRISDKLNREFAALSCFTVLGLEIERTPRRQSANTGPTVSLWYSAPYGGPHRAVEFIDGPGQTAAQKANGFFTVNPDLRVVFHADLSDRSQTLPRTHLLFVIQRAEHWALRDQPWVGAVAPAADLAPAATEWVRNLDASSGDPRVINAGGAPLLTQVPSLAVYQPANGGIGSIIPDCCYPPLGALPSSLPVDCATSEVCDGTPPPITTECPPPCTPPPLTTTPPTLPPPPPPPPEDLCRYTWVSVAECTSDGSAVWLDPVLIDTACVDSEECPETPVWSSQRPSWVAASPNDTCRRWYVACGEDCQLTSDCPLPSVSITPLAPAFPAPVECCPDLCRYTWEVVAECDTLGTPFWGDPTLVDTQCIGKEECPDNPAWSADRPAWVAASDNDVCKRWYVICSEELCVNVLDCPAPPAAIVPEVPAFAPPEECCVERCRYIWRSMVECDAQGNPFWGDPVLVSTACVLAIDCPETPAWSSTRPIGEPGPNDQCMLWYVVCTDDTCLESADCPAPPSEIVPDTPAGPAPQICCEKICRYIFKSFYDCVNLTWGDPVLEQADCVVECDDPSEVWTQQRPLGVVAGPGDDTCAAWYVVCSSLCDEDVDCNNPPAAPLPPEFPKPDNCCDICRYTWVSTVECDAQGNPFWGDPVVIDTTCIPEEDCPENPAWSAQRPAWVGSSDNDACKRWYVACGDDCAVDDDCPAPPLGIRPQAPAFAAPAECCEETCRYTWVSTVECDTQGNPFWGDPALIDTTCIPVANCPDSPAWSAVRPAWVNESANDDCKRWYVVCEGACVESADCPSPSSEITPEAPAFAAPAECCEKVCRYIYRSSWNCANESWGNVTLIDNDCVLPDNCPDVPAWSSTRPAGVPESDNDECYMWYVVCGDACTEDDECFTPPALPERPQTSEPENCCPEVCRYTWVSIAECDSEGNATWGAPTLINTVCIRQIDCPENPAWTADRPAWVAASNEDTCRRWYVACGEVLCDITDDCGAPDPSIVPSPPAGTPPVPPCCTKFCKYTWESTYSCSGSSGGEWSTPILASKECVDGPCESKPWTVGEEDPVSGEIVGSCSAPCKATLINCVEFACDTAGSGADCPDPTEEQTPLDPTLPPPAFDVFANGRINGCNLPLNWATFDGSPAMTQIGPKNNDNCPIDSHFVAAVWSKIRSNVSVCELTTLCGSSNPCESGPTCCPEETSEPCGACSWPCDPDQFGDRISFYITPAGTVASGQSAGAFFCGGFTLAGGGSGCLSAPGGGC